MNDPERLKVLKELVVLGLSNREIGKHLNVHENHICLLRKTAGIPRGLRRTHLPMNDPGRIAALKMLVALGSSNREIAEHLNISEGYVPRLKRVAGIPPPKVSSKPKPLRNTQSARLFDLEDTDEL